MTAAPSAWNDGLDMKRRRFLGAAAAAAGAWTLGAGCTTTTDFDKRVADLRAQFFSGPIQDAIDLETLDPARRPDSTQIGACADFQHMDATARRHADDMLAFAVAAGIKWLRTGYRVADWDWNTRRPKDFLTHYVEAEAKLGIRPLLHTNADDFIGTPEHDQRWLQAARAGLDRWGDKIGAMQFGNEPHALWAPVYGGSHRGGPWLTHYSNFVESVSRQIKRDYPTIKLINGVHLPGVAITQLKRSAPTLDGVDWHNYPFMKYLPPDYTAETKDGNPLDLAPSRVKVDEVAADYLSRARALGHNNSLQLWMTETGIPTALPGFQAPPGTHAPLSEQLQGKWIARMLTVALASSSKAFIYHLWDQGNNRPAKVAKYGLITRRQEPKPAFFVLGRISALTAGRATVDPALHATLTNLDVGAGTPLFQRRIGSARQPGRQVMVREEIRSLWFTGGDGRALLAIWSTYPLLPNFRPRRATFEVNTPLGDSPIVVDPITGESDELRGRTAVRSGGGTRFELAVWNYPQFILMELP
jgi:hypothetical protein